MRPRLSLLGHLLRILPSVFLCCLMASAQTTTFTGTVYSPNGVPNGVGSANTGGDPIPNILVFAADPNYPPPTFTQGQVLPASGQDGCSAQPSLVPGAVLGSALTDYKGNFSFTTSGVLPNPLTIVIQAGKWRRQYHFDSTQVTAGTSNALPALVMPSAQGTDVDLPHIAISTGGADALECIFHQIGIADSEVTAPGGGGSINIYSGSYKSGEIAPKTLPTPSETTLLDDPNTLAQYDVVMFGCQGSSSHGSITTADVSNLTSFANNGGRIFATHFEYYLLQQSPFSTVATVGSPGYTGSAASGLQTSTINTSSTFPEGLVLANWIDYIGADYNGTLGKIQLNWTAPNVASVDPNATQTWATRDKDDSIMQFTFDTPIGASGTPTVSLSYTNNTTAFQQGDMNDSITINATNSSTADANSSLTLAITIPQGFTAISLAGGAGTGWGCNVSTLVCTRQASGAALAASTSDPVTITFNISTTATVGDASIVGTLGGGGLSGTNQCGRVLYNDYHVEDASVSANTVYPAQCSNLSTTTDQQKFLEYSLYNLSNFVAPTTTDLIDVKGPVAASWSTPASSYYGVGLTSAQLNATATDTANGSAVPGTFVYVTGATTVSIGTVLDADTYTITGTFTPTDPVGYTSGATAQAMLTVLPDSTTTHLAASPANTPAGQTVTLTATLTDAYTSTKGQTVTFYDGSATLGTSTVDATNTAVYVINTFSLGSHSIKACLNQTQDYLSSCSTLTSETISPPSNTSATTTIVASDVNPSVVGQAVTFTANVASTGSFSTAVTGTVTFYDGTKSLGTGTLTNGVATFSTSKLAAGTHNITASYAGTAALTSSVSVILAQQVEVSLTSAGTGFVMTVSPTSFSVGAGSAINLGVTVITLNNFNVPVKLSCSGLPAESTCTFANDTIPVGGGSTAVSVYAASPHVCGTGQQYFQASTSRGLPILALMTFLFFARRRRALKGLVLALLLCIIPAVTGCGTCTDLGVRPGTYSFNIVGTATTSGATPVVTVPGDTVSGSTVTQTQAMSMKVTI